MIDAQKFNDTYLLALCVWREARGEPLVGKHAVACVIRNRVRDSRWPSTYRGVILQSMQFSSFNRADPQVTLYPKGDEPEWDECVNAAMATLYNQTDFSNGANHYYATSIVAPRWAREDAQVAHIGNHKFYKL